MAKAKAAPKKAKAAPKKAAAKPKPKPVPVPVEADAAPAEDVQDAAGDDAAPVEAPEVTEPETAAEDAADDAAEEPCAEGRYILSDQGGGVMVPVFVEASTGHRTMPGGQAVPRCGKTGLRLPPVE